ncbi:unnamed protein product [Scytosiphon promiscuus]
MIINVYCISLLWLSCLCDWGGTVPTVQERADVGDEKGDAPRVGLVDLEACTVSTTDDACMQNMEIVSALDADEYLSVTAFEKGVLDCDSLEKAEDASELRFALTKSEEVTAKRKSFTIKSGEAFSNNNGRMVWTGEVMEKQRVFGGIPRSIAMSWSDCDVETFVLRVHTPQHDGTTRSTVTLPCTDPSEPLQVCLLQIDHAAEEEVLETLVDDEGEESPEQHQTRGNQSQGQKGREDREEADDDNYHTRRRRRHLRKTTDGGDESSTSDSSSYRDDFSSSSDGGHQRQPTSDSRRGNRRPRRRTTEVHRRLAREVSEGIEAARARDPDVDAKDEDVRLLSEYLEASQPEQEAFHGRGVRRLSSAEVQMPSGRILTASMNIDVMVLYTAASLVKSSANSALMTEQQMETEIITAYAEANDALADSGISATVNIVHIARASVAFVESSDMNTDLADIAAGKGKAKGFDALRTKYGADLVQMIGSYKDSCGTGYVMAVPRAAFGTYGYSIVHVHCLMNFSHIHELGHNMGANHDRESSSTDHEYAHAQRYCSGNVPYRTIMAYETGCLTAPRVPMFSAKGKKYAGRSLGTKTTDNARVIRESLTTVVNFRDQVVVPTAAADDPSQKAGDTNQAPQPEEDQQQEEVVITPTSEGDSSSNTYQACYRHSWSDFQLGNIPIIDYMHTSRSTCRAHCSAAGFAYYVLEFGFMCSCGDNLPDESSAVTSASCSLPCADSLTGHTCGGNWHQEVFSIDTN